MSGGTLTLIDSTISGNQTTANGGGNADYPGGGGIWNNGGTVSINSSILSENSSSTNGGAIWDKGPLTISNSILSGNSAQLATAEGSTPDVNLSSYSSPTGDEVTISNSTITANTAAGFGGGIDFVVFGTGCGSFMSPCSTPSSMVTPPEVHQRQLRRSRYCAAPAAWTPRAPITWSALSSDPTDLTGNFNHVNVSVGSLNLDAALTPGLGSPALNAGSTRNAPPTDIYGNPRTLAGTIDIGAVEHVVTWTGAAGDDLWDNPKNWRTQQVPTASDVVVINIATRPESRSPRPGTMRSPASRATCRSRCKAP